MFQMMMLSGVRIKNEMHNRFDQERDDTEKIKKWCSEIKSDLKVYVDLTMKGK